MLTGMQTYIMIMTCPVIIVNHYHVMIVDILYQISHLIFHEWLETEWYETPCPDVSRSPSNLVDQAAYVDLLVHLGLGVEALAWPNIDQGAPLEYCHGLLILLP